MVDTAFSLEWRQRSGGLRNELETESAGVVAKAGAVLALMLVEEAVVVVHVLRDEVVELTRFGGQVTSAVRDSVAERTVLSRQSRYVKRMVRGADHLRAAETASKTGRCSRAAGDMHAGPPRPSAMEGRSRGYPQGVRTSPTARMGRSGPLWGSFGWRSALRSRIDAE